MADLALIHQQEHIAVPRHYAQIGTCGDYRLLADTRHAWPNELSITRNAAHGCVLALLGPHGQCQAQKILDGLCKRGTSALAMTTGLVAGVVLFEETGEFCVFRDKMGMIPMMLRLGDDSRLLTMATDPILQMQLNAGAALSHAWIGNFLRGIDSDDRDDVYRGSQRLRAGECLVLKDKPNAPFDHAKAKTKTNSQTSLTIPQFNYYWDGAAGPDIGGSRDELCAQLRTTLCKAVDTIPNDGQNLFTISGGLDSSGIVGIVAANRHKTTDPPIDAISLISVAYPECDESVQLDILESYLPLSLHRVVMDDAYTLSEPNAYKGYGAYGPLVAPGIERSLCLHRKARKEYGFRRIITGYGGNFIVKVRREALWRDLVERIKIFEGLKAFNKARLDLADELRHLDKHPIKTEIARFLANIHRGIIPKLAPKLGKLSASKRLSFLTPKSQHSPWLNADFARQYLAEIYDPIYALSHRQERRHIPRSWEWEMSVRALDTVVRLTQMPIYDPLLDPELYNVSSRIPPRYFLENGRYRPLYIEALRDFLPTPILEHPKVVFFDGIVHDGLKTKSVETLEVAIEAIVLNPLLNGILDAPELLKAYRLYREQSELPFSFPHFWRALALALGF